MLPTNFARSLPCFEKKIDLQMMIRPLVFLTVFVACLATQGFAQKGGKKAKDLPYSFEVTGVSDTAIYLANYYGEKLFYADTAFADSKGRFGFKEVAPEKEGKYAVVLPGQKYFEIIIADGERIVMQTDTTDYIDYMKITESENNKIMYAYIDFLAEKKTERERIFMEIEENEGNPEVTAALKAEYNRLNEAVIAYQKAMPEKHPDKLAAREVAMGMEPEPPAELQEDREKAYYWYKRHYFDQFDLNDDRIVRLPIFHNKLMNYITKTVVQDPDTLIKAVDELVARTEQGSEVFKYIVHYATYHFETSKIMGQDRVFVHMVDTYYKTGKADWMNEENLDKITDKADSKRYTLIGNKLPELILADTAETWISTHRDIKNKYLLVYFYDPDCGHCKKVTPKLVEFYKNYEGDLAVYAVSGNNDNKWLKFVKKNEMPFFNVSIPQKAYEDADFATSLLTGKKTNYHSLRYQEHYDVYSTPKLILTDGERRILAKDIGVEQLGEILERIEGSVKEPGAGM